MDSPPMESTFMHRGFSVPDPFAPRQKRVTSLMQSILATTLFRCWHIILVYGLWATAITICNNYGFKIALKPTLLTVIGTLLGFVITTRTNTSFDRYNEGRRMWGLIIQSSRMFARAVWFHVPDPSAANEGVSLDEIKTRALIEKRSVLNLIEAYGVAVKHYLRAEDGIYYKDLYHLVKFLPAFSMSYSIPDGIISREDSTFSEFSNTYAKVDRRYYGSASELHPLSPPPAGLPYNITQLSSVNVSETTFHGDPRPRRAPGTLRHLAINPQIEQTILPRKDEKYLLSARHPPNYGLFDIFPFSLIRSALIKRTKGKTERSQFRAKLRSTATAHNLPLEITLYISSYIAALQKRKAIDVPTTNQLQGALSQLVESLTGLERILTTPIPFSYSIHLWTLTSIYVFFMPLEIWNTLKWLTIPATMISAFVFFGFLVAGEEIENPFGYDKNDLDLDHFTHIIRCELKAITSAPPPDPAEWAFVPENNMLISSNVNQRIPPNEWIKMGYSRAQQFLCTPA